jgi:hypothetical protein
MVLARLSTAGMRVIISKSNFFAEQIEYLRYWITRQGIQPIRNKVDTILHTKSPKTRKEEPAMPLYLYSQLLSWHVVSQKWASSHLPLTSLTSSKVKFECHSSHQQAFDKIKKVLERRYFSAIQISISLIPFIFILMHQIISWGQSS